MARSNAASPVKKWRPASNEWLEVFARSTATLKGAEQRKMFGYPAVFVNGNMFAGLHEVGLVLRLPESERNAFLRLAGARAFEPMPGRVMREYVVAPAAFASKPSEVARWLHLALAYASSLPPKASRARKSK